MKHIFDPGSEPYRKPFAEWCAEWIRWALSIPKKLNPAADLTGKNCSQNQSGPVWFLAGTYGGYARRKCTIPAQKAIFFPLIAKECSFAEDYDLKRTVELRKRVGQVIDLVTRLELIINRVKIDNLRKYRADSDVFDLVFPKNNVYNVPAGPTKSVTDGYWIFLRPFPVGEHEIYFNAQITFPKSTTILELAKRYNKIKSLVFKNEVLYKITVTNG